MKTILLLTDFSENSINAMRYALQLFKNEVCTFIVLHVQSSATYTTDNLMLSGNESIYNSLIKKSKEKLNTLVDRLKEDFKNEDFTYKTIVDYDVLTDAINQVKSSQQIDLIVMGTNGVTGAREVVFGSNTINVIRKVHCPTLVIPEKFSYAQPSEVLLPLDALDSLGGPAFKEVTTFANRFSKKLHVVRILPQNEDSKDAIKDQEHIDNFLKELEYDYHVIQNVPMPYAVRCYTQTHAIDLTTLIVQKESLFERFIIGSSTTQISNTIQRPLLVFHS